MSTLEGPGEAGRDETRVLLLLQRRNRELLGRWLASGWTVLTAEDGLPEAFDVCVLDAAAFGEHRETLERWKRDAEPEFLPYLLVVREGNRPYVDQTIRDLVDEVIVIPATPAEFAIRLNGLLRARWQSLALKEQKEHEIAALARQNERLDQFASIVSHDLRNPITVISGALELTRQTDDTEHLDLAEDAVARMQNLIDGLLELARQGQSGGETTPVDLETVARKAWSVVHHHGATLVVDSTVTVEADEERLHALFENLFRNSVEHGSTRSRQSADHCVEDDSTRGRTEDGVTLHAAGVTIHVGPLPGDRRGFYVTDDGPGIPTELRERVVEHGYTTDPEGTGLGLSIVTSIADAHDWAVTITDGDDGGARFEFDCNPERAS